MQDATWLLLTKISGELRQNYHYSINVIAGDVSILFSGPKQLPDQAAGAETASWPVAAAGSAASR